MKESIKEIPGNGLEYDLKTLTWIVLQRAYGETTPASRFREQLDEGADRFYDEEREFRDDDPEAWEYIAEALVRFQDFANTLVHLESPLGYEGPLAFERWLEAAVSKFIKAYRVENDMDAEDLVRFRQLCQCLIEQWGLIPSLAVERRCGIEPSRSELGQAASLLPVVPLADREYVPSGRNELHPFKSKGESLKPVENDMLRRVGILPADWDEIYGEIVERSADNFWRYFFPVFRWILLDPHDICLFVGERISVELLPGFEALFSTFVKDVVSTAMNQTLRIAADQAPGTGPGMREFACTVYRQ